MKATGWRYCHFHYQTGNNQSRAYRILVRPDGRKVANMSFEKVALQCALDEGIVLEDSASQCPPQLPSTSLPGGLV